MIIVAFPIMLLGPHPRRFGNQVELSGNAYQWREINPMENDHTLDLNLSDGPQTIPLDSSAPDHSPEPTHKKNIGPYHLVRKIGEGGMGIVYEANQFAPIRRRVALKMVKPKILITPKNQNKMIY